MLAHRYALRPSVPHLPSLYRSQHVQISFLQLINHWLASLGPRAAAVRWCMGMAAVWMLWMAHLGPVQAAGPLLLRDADNTVAAWPACGFWSMSN